MKELLSIVGSLSLLLTSGIGSAQIVDRIEADIPFAFHAGLAKFPAGKYILHVDENSDLSIVEIQSADGKNSALIEVRDAQAPSTPRTGELVFNHVGDRYFLAEIFDDGQKYGSAVMDSGYSKKYGVGLVTGEQKHIPIHHAGS